MAWHRRVDTVGWTPSGGTVEAPLTPLLELAGIRVQATSMGGVETCIRLPDLGLCFDMGSCPRDAVRLKTVLFTHAHVDHMAGVVHHCATRDMQGMAPPLYVMPPRLCAPFRAMLDAWADLDGSPLPCRIQPLAPGEELELKKGIFARPFATPHRVLSQGYVLVDRRQKLRPELQGLPGEALRARKAAGLPLTVERDAPLFAFTGDSRIEGLVHNPLALKAELLVMEVTFLDERVSVEATRDKGHIHLDEVIERAEMFENRAILFTHLSTRYGPREAWQIVARRLPPSLRDRVTLLAWANRSAEG